MVDHDIRAQRLDRPIAIAKADGDEWHARRARCIRVCDRIADIGSAATAGSGDRFAQLFRIRLLYRQRIAADDRVETAAPPQRFEQQSVIDVVG
jgi:hypothetical protein